MDSIRRLSIGTWLFIAACFGVAGVLLYKNANMQDWSGWAQALGSVGAIWGSFALARKSFADQRALDQDKAQLEQFQRRLQQFARLEVVMAISYDALQALNEALRQARNEFNQNFFQLRAARLEDVQYLLRGLLIQDLPDRSVEPLLLLQQSVSRTLRDVQKWYEAKQDYPFDPEILKKLAGRVDKAKTDALAIPAFRQYWANRHEKDCEEGHFTSNGLGPPPI